MQKKTEIDHGFFITLYKFGDLWKESLTLRKSVELPDSFPELKVNEFIELFSPQSRSEKI